MSVRYEWGHVLHPFFRMEVVPKGTQLGEFAVESDVAIVFETDEVYILEGPTEVLRKHLSRVLGTLEDLDRPAEEGITEKEQRSE